MPQRRAATQTKIVLGFVLGIAVYYAFENLTAPEWIDSMEARMAECESRGMGGEFTVGEGELKHLECVDSAAPDEPQPAGADVTSSKP
jgi:hypothetical protein